MHSIFSLSFQEKVGSLRGKNQKTVSIVLICISVALVSVSPEYYTHWYELLITKKC